MERSVRSRTRCLVLASAIACASEIAQADHEAAFYPSFYPQEIRIEAIDRAAASAGWPKARVHAYVGENLFDGFTPAADAAPIESLGALVTLTFDASPGRMPAARDAAARCAAARRVVRSLPAGAGTFVGYPYPVTPWHADYLQEFDLVRRAQVQYAASGADAPADGDIKVRAIGPLAQALLPASSKADSTGWDATLETFDVDRLAATETGNWLAPPWVKQGWFQAHKLYKDQVSGEAAAKSDATYRKLVTGDYRSPVERINLERMLVSTLVAGCERVVVGYTLRREYFNAEYSNGVENVAFDSQSGLVSRIFPRTVKLKDFPWNGWLRLGMSARPTAAWNPMGGLTDPFGRLLWLSMSDPALLPDPYGASWIANRVSVEPARKRAAISIPPDALRPDVGTGRLRAVGARKTARQVLRYSIVTSAFHDGTAMDKADILYPYVFAYRWSARDQAAATFDPLVARSTALMRQWLAGFKVIGTRTQTRDYGGDVKYSYRVFVVDVYLDHRSGDPWEAAAIAPPWSTLPWEVTVLMEEAVQRGIAAFSPEEAQRRSIPWLDLVRDRATGERLAALVDRFRDEGYRPAALESLVSASEARARWSALRTFYAQHGHFLVTNGPYRLDSWSAERAVLTVFRDPGYPQGVGTFDDYALPRKAFVSKVEDLGDRIEITADAEKVSRFQRSYELKRAPVEATSGNAPDPDSPECRYAVIADDGSVVRAGIAPFARAGRFVADLRELPGPGNYSVVIAMFAPPNRIDPAVKVVLHRVPGARKARQTTLTRLSMPAATGKAEFR